MVLQLASAYIAEGKAVIGIEFGSTRIKAVLTGPGHQPLATGSHAWENRYEGGLWTYSLDDVWAGLADCYKDLKQQVQTQYGVTLTQIGGLGISAMMHGYLALNGEGKLLTPFRTWRNTNTGAAAEQLTALFGFNIPQRWSIAHLYQAILNDEPHVKSIAALTTLAGYVHWRLTGERVLGVGDASGMFPIDPDGTDYDAQMLKKFDALVENKGYPWKLRSILPRVMQAGEQAGKLSAEGARLLDPTGALLPGAILCPPEGDAGTGMTATNSIAARTGNVSAGTSIFAMIVLDKPLSKVYPEIDLVTTPAGKPVAMVHCNNCSSDIDAWVNLFAEFTEKSGAPMEKAALYELLFQSALQGDADCGGLVAINYLSGEPIAHMQEGRPMFLRLPDGALTLGNFMRAHLYGALATLRLGLDILLGQEHVALDKLYGHGGYLKTTTVGQRMMAAATGVPISVMETAGEGGAWGAAILAAYAAQPNGSASLEEYLEKSVFAGNTGVEMKPNRMDKDGFSTYMERFVMCLLAERTAVNALHD